MEGSLSPSTQIPFVLPDAVSGQISIWKGAIGTIPDGWVICDGNNGTPDLRDKFVVAAGGTYAVDATGGTVDHFHRLVADGHVHDIPGGVGIGSGIDLGADRVELTKITGDTDAENHLPTYYSLAYIMYV